MNILHQRLQKVLRLYYQLPEEYEASYRIKAVDDYSTIQENVLLLKFALKDAIDTLPLSLKKIVLLKYQADLGARQLCNKLGLKFRVDAYRRLDLAYEHIISKLGPDFFHV